MSPTNPHEYDDGAYTQAAIELQGNLVDILNSLWEAGASLPDIESEIANAIENSDIPPSGMPNVRVEITITE